MEQAIVAWLSQDPVTHLYSVSQRTRNSDNRVEPVKHARMMNRIHMVFPPSFGPARYVEQSKCRAHQATGEVAETTNMSEG